MDFIIEILVEAFILVLLARMMPSVHVRSFGTAVGVALVVGLLNATLGAIIRFPLNLVTFFLLGFLVRLVVTALMIKLADAFFKGFEVASFGTALIIAVVLAITGTLLDYIF